MDENNPPQRDMGDNNAPRTMFDFAKPHLTGAESSIIRPAISANNFELKPNRIQMIQQFVQFDGLQDEDPNTHIANFLEFCDTFKINGISDDAIRLRLFPFSLRNKDKQWLNSCRDALRRMREIQRSLEKVPTPWSTLVAISTFYNGVNPSTRQLIDSAAGGTLNKKNSTSSLRCDASRTVANPEYPSYQPGAEDEQMNYIGRLPSNTEVNPKEQIQAITAHDSNKLAEPNSIPENKIDEGASINVMPYSLFKRLGLGKPKQTRMSIQLADKTVGIPRGIIEDVLVKIDKFVFPVDFVVLDMDDDNSIPLILGRPFLATAKTKIDVATGELILRVSDESINLQALDSARTTVNKELQEEQSIRVDNFEK
ncbi:Retrovirus-related Pol polyprotein from transposon opus [Gossypium australe]|uniref:Retrovirus-related Pol polyprotein from transposon opus n=1 Tax=Gossypium australe TaxID=47621 RepID=A0A5B6WRJ8_9ROSI|nr:Retrovirus-related Pol polyprotein from transposon opus [Gossypium australe]